MALSNVSGFPRIGRNRELKFATEGYWQGERSADELAATAKAIRVENWKLMQKAGIDLIPSNDFSYYDQVLDTIALVGAVPERYGWGGGQVDLDTYFAMARGRQTDDVDVTAMEMTKWFNTNYHYIVPELGPDTRFSLASSKPFDEHAEAMEEVGIDTVPVLIGPVSFLLLSKPADGVDEGFDALTLIEPLVEVYGEVIERLAEQGATWVQFDEPCFVEDREERELDALRLAYEELCKVHERPRIVVKTYFDHVGDAYGVLRDLPIEGVGLDFTGRVHGNELGPEVHEHGGRHNAEFVAELGGLDDQWLFAGIVDGRNVWGNHLEHSLDALEGLGDRSRQLVVSTSCSLLHVPIDLEAEPDDGDADLDAEMRSWMAFAVQKVGEVATLARGVADGREAIAAELDANDRARDSRRDSHRTRNPEVRARVEALTEADARRAMSFADRKQLQLEKLGLPTFPATTIGSFPQTDEIRTARRQLGEGEIQLATYEERMRAEVDRVIDFQEEIGIDVLVHGEPERNDMVQYFAEQMLGYAFTENAWVQSYGSRCVRPPIIFGDISRGRAHDGRMDHLCAVEDREAGEGNAHRPGHDARVVLRPRRPAQAGDLRAAGPDNSGRGSRSRGGRDPDHPCRRAGNPRGPAAAPRSLERVPGVGGLLLPDRDGWRRRRDPGPHPHVLLGLRRHPGAHPGDGCGRHPDRGGPLTDGAAPSLGADRLHS